jgi:uncharacterized protein (TIGR02118 family)
MMKMVFFFTRKAGLTPEQFREYYETKHVPLALSLLPFFADYTRNYVRNDLGFERPSGGPNKPGPSFDVVTELTFASRADYDRMMQALSDPAIIKQIAEDEANFMDRSAHVIFFADAETTPHEKLKESI